MYALSNRPVMAFACAVEAPAFLPRLTCFVLILLSPSFLLMILLLLSANFQGSHTRGRCVQAVLEVAIVFAAFI